MNRRLLSLVAVTMLSSIAVAGSACTAQVAEESRSVASTLIDRSGDRVMRSVLFTNGEWETHIYRASGERLQDVVVRSENGVRVVIAQSFVDGQPQAPVRDALPSELTFELFHAAARNAADPARNGSLAEGKSFFDNYGCDMAISSCSSPGEEANGHGRCCDIHDACYAQHGCTATSWWLAWPLSACDRCNSAVMLCSLGPPVGDSVCCSFPSTDPRACGKPRPTTTTTTTSGGGGCFVPGTPITMADGSEKAIEDVKIGDEVLSFDPDTQKVVTSRVSATFVHATTTENLVVIDGHLVATANHPFYANGKWVRADALHPGDDLRRLDVGHHALSVGVGSVEGRSLPSTPVYNLEVAGTHDYFADGILVHNKNTTAEPTEVPYEIEGGGAEGGGGGFYYYPSSEPTLTGSIGDIPDPTICPGGVCP